MENIKIHAFGLEDEAIKPWMIRENFFLWMIFSWVIWLFDLNNIKAIYKRYKAPAIWKNLNKFSYRKINSIPKAQHKTTNANPTSSPNIIHKVFLYPKESPKEKARLIHNPGSKETETKGKINKV